jgi:hypothetical protein
MATAHSAEHILVLLDCSRPMWTPLLPDPAYPADLLAPADRALQVLGAFLRQEVRRRESIKAGRRNCLGVLLYHTQCRESLVWDSPLQRRRHDLTPAFRTEQEEMDEEAEEDGSAEDPDNQPQPATGPTTVHELLPLEPPGIATILTLQATQDDGINERELDIAQVYAPAPDVKVDPNALQTALLVAGGVWQQAKFVQQKATADRPPDRCRVWIMSNQDAPGVLAHATALDMKERGIDISFWPMPHPAKASFDYQGLQKELPTVALRQQEPAVDLKEWWSDNQILDEMNAWKSIRPTAKLPLLWPGDSDVDESTAHLQLDWYRLVQSLRKPGKVQVHQETGYKLKTLTQFVDKEGGSGEILFSKVAGMKEPLLCSPRLCTYVEFAKTKVPLSYAEQAILKRQSHPHSIASLRVLGFRPADAIDKTASNFKEAFFCVPPADEASRVKGSQPAFAALYGAMVKKNCLMMGELLMKVNATSCLVAAWPIEARITELEEGYPTYIHPAGLLVIVLPFRDAIKAPVEDAATQATEPLASEELVVAAREIVDKWTLKDVEIGVHYPNESLERFWDKMQEVALNERTSSENNTAVAKEEILAKVGPCLDRFMELLPEDPVVVKGKKKRELVEDDSGIDWLDAYKEDRLGDFKVADLKKYLKSVGETVSGNKPVLIDRMIPYLKQEADTEPKIKMDI